MKLVVQWDLWVVGGRSTDTGIASFVAITVLAMVYQLPTNYQFKLVVFVNSWFVV